MTTITLSIWILLILGSFGHLLLYVDGKKILMMALPVGSHIMQANSVAEGLIDRGHEVHAIIDVTVKSFTKFLHPDVKVIFYDLGKENTFTNRVFQEQLIAMEVEDMTMGEKTKIIGGQLESYKADCIAMWRSEDLLQNVKEEKFDFVIFDGGFKCYAVIPHRLGIPFGVFMSFLPLDIPHAALQAPLLVPGPFDGFLTPDGAPIVFTTLLKFLMTQWMARMFNVAEEYSNVAVSDMMKETKLWLYDKCRMFDTAIPVSPNVIHVGGLNIRPPKPLQEGALKKFVDNASDGFIVVCFGSYAKYVPSWIVKTLVESFGKLPYKIVWKFDKDDLRPEWVVPKNVFIIKWLPQNDILGHKNIKLFITHAGNSGQHEALYNGVPMLAMPLFGDQTHNAMEIQRRTYGLYLRMKDLTTDALISMIHEVISQPQFRETIKRASQIFRDEPMSPMETAAYWIDHVMKYGADHLQSRTNELSWFQILMIDVLLVVLLTIICMCVFIFLVCRFVYRRCCKAKHNVDKLKCS